MTVVKWKGNKSCTGYKNKFRSDFKSFPLIISSLFRLQLTLYQRQKPRFRKQLVSGWLPFHHCTAVPVYWVGNRVSVEKVAAMILRNWRGNLVVLQVKDQNLNWRKGKVVWEMTTAYRNLQRKVRAFPAITVRQVLRKSHQPQGLSVELFRCRSWVHKA